LSAARAPAGQVPAVFSPSYTIPKSTPGEWRVITDLKWCAGKLRRDSVNAATDFAAGPKCVFGHALKRVIGEVYAARLREPHKPIYIWVCDVADAFRQLYFNPDYAPWFCSVVDEWVLVELRGVFGWCLTPGEFDVLAQALRHLVRSKRPSAPASEAALALALRYVRVEPPPPGTVITPIPADPAACPPPLAPDAPVDIHHHVDDGAMVETRRELLCKISALVIDAHLQLLGYAPGSRECPVSLKKLLAAAWATRAKFLGLIIDTNSMTLELPEDKQRRLVLLVFDIWGPARTHASEHDLECLIGELRFAAMCFPHGKFFLWRLRATLNAAKLQPHRRSIALTADFHADVAWWRWLVQRIGGMQTSLTCPLWQHVKVPPHLAIASDASRKALGGCCEGRPGRPGWWWCLQLPPDLVARYNAYGTSSAVFVNETELAGMLLNAWVALVLRRELPACSCLLLLGDNTSAVSWISKAGTTRNAAAGTLVRALGALAVATEVSFKAQHVQGVDNVLPDAISRFLVGKPPVDGVPAPTLPADWSQVQLPPSLCDAVLGTLRGSCGLAHWLQLLQRDMAQLGAAAPAGAPSAGFAACPSS
jgi:hypothetical protein